MKTRKNHVITVISSIVCLLPMILSAVVYNDLPEQIAIQWGAGENPQNFMPKAIAAFGLPALFMAINVFSKLRLLGDPKRDNASVVMRAIYAWLIPVISLAVVPVILFIAIGVNIPISIIGSVSVGGAFILFGNYLPKNRQNYIIGIKLPWTLDDADNWNKTHRLAGYLWILGGIVLITGSFISYGSSAWIVISASVLVLIIIAPFLYSYSLYIRSGKGAQ